MWGWEVDEGGERKLDNALNEATSGREETQLVPKYLMRNLVHLSVETSTSCAYETTHQSQQVYACFQRTYFHENRTYSHENG